MMKASHAALAVAWKTAFRSSNSPASMRRYFDLISGASAEALTIKYPSAKFQSTSFGGVPAEIISTTAQPEKTILYLHGGGYFMGSITAYRRNAMRIAHRCGVRVVIPEYRLAPEHPYPAALMDAKNVYASLIDDQDPKQIIFGGDSAGGGLVLATLLALRDDGVPLPRSAFCISPWTDLESTGDSMETNKTNDVCLNRDRSLSWANFYVGTADIRNPYISPLHGNYAGLPPLLLMVGDHEVLLDDSVRVAKKAERAGVKVELHVAPLMQHVWFLTVPWLEQSRLSMKALGEFVAR